MVRRPLIANELAFDGASLHGMAADSRFLQMKSMGVTADFGLTLGRFCVDHCFFTQSDVVENAHQMNPGIADELASFYAQHSGLIKTLGGAALAIALAKMKNHIDQG